MVSIFFFCYLSSRGEALISLPLMYIFFAASLVKARKSNNDIFLYLSAYKQIARLHHRRIRTVAKCVNRQNKQARIPETSFQMGFKSIMTDQ